MKWRGTDGEQWVFCVGPERAQVYRCVWHIVALWNGFGFGKSDGWWRRRAMDSRVQPEGGSGGLAIGLSGRQSKWNVNHDSLER